MQRPEDAALSRKRPFDPKRTCLLLIDTQNYVWNEEVAARLPEFDRTVRSSVIPNLQRLIAGFREAGAEVMYTVMENLTRDGRDRSLDYKLSNFFIAKGSWEAKVFEAVAPGEDDIVLPKTSSGVFNSTNIEYLLRNIGIDTLVITGFLTDQCVDHTVRDAADRGFYPVCISDACATHSEARHRNALAAFAGYCRTLTTEELLAELPGSQGSRSSG
ncbi:cysteine hydrolase family protein [Aurantimonas sp. VKM B-3413]|uniref:cysteine hydrolase family protein n=1 Tax=Aurantimonas sp. VKM B-3413 TaxID=2779401 RepID=UPI001E6538AB|nr:isochorismatase family cysteine hydrolase [Aurantimonas sp. VKM B-3413]MCB8839470.1 cysteine hydrolase [Aurantimonas sp. VKM B-3413]